MNIPHKTDAPLPVTVVIPVRNEESNLHQCLSRLGRFAEIVVIDSGSTDRTVAIAQDHGAGVLHFIWDGSYPKKRNWYLLNHQPKSPWVLFLDADELIDDCFCDALAQAIKDDSIQGFWLVYRNWFLGRPLRHGLAQRKLACFRVGAALYERIDEDRWSRLDMEVHEHPVVNGRTGEISAPIDHRDDKGIARFIERHRDYAEWEAKRFLRLQEDSAVWEAFTPRQRFKYQSLERWWFPWFYFVFVYILKLGFLDGRAGFHYAAYKAWYFRTISLLIEEYRLARTSKRGDDRTSPNLTE